MKLSPRFQSLVTAFGLATTIAFAQGADAQAQSVAGVSPQVDMVAGFMQAQSLETVVVLDKANAELLVIDRGQVVMRSPALYGRGQGEDERADGRATPSGIFALREYTDRKYDGDRVLAFLCHPNACYVIHPTWHGKPTERRDERLATPTPDDNTVSNGCINVPFEFYQRMSAYLQSRANVVTENGRSMAWLPRLVVLPENTDLAATRRILGISASNAVNISPAP